ncbi:restriction endonuclease subunit S [Haemophilus influenzae]|uniref:Type I restriction enzyme HindI specificity subunit n=1 Tax=Haemophilus influenzae (strain ATCC 51907 / DSM 11121 / KW20 / Rd) TaxID=71421 RepID=T1SH_HAEIN|nr:restriction endonuclease subunit S [Haemophilus influenzae]P44152.1 RecName: Full=Type I restriction enzyme HindI specificity subunit; Short=S protein; AltName: Full=Type I specificity subunit S.HindI; Short=S.HindI; AltName: Full=Type-1 restriction enzyme HindVIIP specificity subunit [Haemophilus influenzae Rd KW20]AAC22935.1 type I restriction/modification specificity protein (hsdS) [Haemophilus influenzae Rd KW20]ARB89663.1 restriction endonuclease subunit S [Haemophilus influenzae]EEW758
MSDWKEYSLGDISRNISRRFDFNAYPNVVFINTGDVLNNKFLHCEISNVKDLPGQAKKAIKKGDILYSEIRPGNGRYLFVDNDLDNYVVSTKFMVIEPNANIVLPEFLFLLLISNETTEYFKMIAESRSGTFPQITFDSVSSLSLNIPDKETQQKILDIITPLDDKIELNTQINQTLEQIAQALFKSWFVDFDPVRAKAQALSDGMSLEQAELAAMQAISGKTPEELTALSQTQPDRYAELAETAKAFPCEMVEVDGVEVDGVEVPRGWEMKALSDLGQIICGKTPSKSNKEFYGDDVPFIKIPDMHNQVFITQTTDNLSVVGANYQSKKYIPAKSICVSCIATVGLVSMTSKPSHTNQQINSIIPDDEQSCEFLYLSLKQPSMTKYLKDLASGGTATLNLNTSTFSKIEIITPSKEIIYIFQKKVVSIFEKTLSNSIENKRLTEIRDLLLPRLLNGEI